MLIKNTKIKKFLIGASIIILISLLSVTAGKFTADIMTVGYFTESKKLIYFFTLPQSSLIKIHMSLNDSDPGNRATGYIGLIGMKKANIEFLAERLNGEKEPYLRKILIEGIAKNENKDLAVKILRDKFDTEDREIKLYILQVIKKTNEKKLEDFLSKSDDQLVNEFKKINELKLFDARILF